MTDEERQLLVEISLGLAAALEKFASGCGMADFEDLSSRYRQRVADLTMRVADPERNP